MTRVHSLDSFEAAAPVAKTGKPAGEKQWRRIDTAQFDWNFAPLTQYSGLGSLLLRRTKPVGRIPGLVVAKTQRPASERWLVDLGAGAPYQVDVAPVLGADRLHERPIAAVDHEFLAADRDAEALEHRRSAHDQARAAHCEVACTSL